MSSQVLAAEAILRILSSHEVRFAVIGALGAVLHGSPLRTDDVDICPQPTARNLRRLANALQELNAKEWDPSTGEAVERQWSADQLAIDKLWILMTDPGDLDLVFAPAGFDGFQELDNDAVSMEVGEISVRVASLAAIIRSKEVLNRDVDRAQLPTLRRLQRRLSEGN